MGTAGCTSIDEIKVLRRQISELQQERDDLARDVENLCMHTTAYTTFSSSSVLQERIYVAEKELSGARSQLREALHAKDSMAEDLKSFKAAKRVADDASRQLQVTIDSLSRELSFFKSQSAQAMVERDAIMNEADELRASLHEALQSIEKQASQQQEERDIRKKLEKDLESAEARVSKLEMKAEEAALVPGLRREVSQLHDRLHKVEEDLIATCHELKTVNAVLKAAQKDIGDQQQKIKGLEEEVEENSQTAAQATQQKVEVLLRLAALEKEYGSAKAARSKAETDVHILMEKLDEVTKQKVAALVELAGFKAAGAVPLRSPVKSTGLK